MPEEEEYPIFIEYNGNYYEIDDKQNVTEAFTITKIYDDGTTETQIVRKGNNYGMISYKKRDEELFKGWSKSPDKFNLANVVDFLDVSEDMTVYAHYTSENYARIWFEIIYHGGTKKINRLFIMTARPLFTASTGLEMNHNGITKDCEDVKIKDSHSFKIQQIGGKELTFTARSVFGTTIGNLGVYDIPVSELSDGVEMTFYPYYITKDGTKVEGVERSRIWHEKYEASEWTQ